MHKLLHAIISFFFLKKCTLCNHVLSLTQQKIAVPLYQLSKRFRFIGNCFWLLGGDKAGHIKNKQPRMRHSSTCVDNTIIYLRIQYLRRCALGTPWIFVILAI